MAGGSLAQLIPKQGFQLDRAIAIANQVAAGLFALHSGGRLHLAVNPGAIAYDPETGSARLLDKPADVSPALAYISPEETGRIGRPADHRSDLYSLGATLFHLLCGRPPFAASDPLELVHAQLARIPPDPRTVRPGLPSVLAQIVLKLLAKEPDERYQTIAGLQADLAECARQLREHGRLEPFPIARRDAGRLLRLPDRLYGRNREIAQLGAALERVSSGATELVLIGGQSGSGKSALAEQMRGAAASRHGSFLSGKFEQMGEPTPFAPIRQAFAGFIERLVAEDSPRIAQWRPALEAALAEQGQVIIDVIPEAELLLGEQPAVESLGPVEAQYRFTRVFQQFLQVLAAPGQPLVLFLDDWQWADSASLRLMEDILASPDLRGLLVLGAYRENEVGPSHPVTAFLERLRQKSVPMSQVTVPPLAEEDVAALVADALDRPRDEVAEMARELHHRVEGNPFYLGAFLRDLCDSRTLSVDAAGTWQWDMQRLMRTAPPESVVRLVGTRLARLPAPTREVLKVAACIGSTFSRELLALAHGVPVEAIDEAIEPALQAGVVSQAGERLRFLHDRVQEAAHALIGKGEAPALELAMGRRLTAAIERGKGEEYLSQAVQHLNAGRAGITDEGERRHLARLNLRAAANARRSTAYASAAHHARIGIELLGEAGWRNDYPTSFELHALSAECEYLGGHFDFAETLYPRALAQARTDLDRIRILNIRKDQYELQGRYLDAIAVLRDGLTLVGITFPDTEEAMREAMRKELAEIPRNLRGRRISALVYAPALEDPLKVATLRMLMGMWPSCYVAGLQPLLHLVSVKIANFSLQHGNSEITSAAYVNYSFVAGLLTGDYEHAYEFGQVGIALAERYPERSVRAWCHFLFGCGTLVWRRRLREGLPHLERSVELGIASGNIACASYAAAYIVTDSFMRGARVDEVRRLYERHFPFLARNNPAIHVFGQLGTMALRELAGFEDFDEEAFLATFGKAEFFRAVYLFGKVCACYLGDRIEEGASHVDEALELVPRLLAGTFKVPETLFYAALTLARVANGRVGAERESAIARIENLGRRLRALSSASCPDNIAHKARLVEAEVARLRGWSDEALAAYEEAVVAAERVEFLQDEALIHEHCARHLNALGLRGLARAMMREAIAAWARWGAGARVRLLEREFPGLAPRPAEAPPPSIARNGPLDWHSVTKASQAISREIDFDRLVERLVEIVGENAGARRAVLFLNEPGDLLAVAEADLSAEPSVRRPRVPLARFDAPAAIVEDAWRRGEAIVLADAAREGPYVKDPQVAAMRLRSVLCMPVRHQSVLRGVLYLENDLGSGIFTEQRRESLEHLLAQVAISLENARLYTELRENEERLAGIFDQTLAGIAQTDLTGRIVRVNARYAQMVGREPSELIGMRMQELTHPDDLEHTLELFAPLTQGRGGPFNVEKRYLRPDGPPVWVSNSVSLIRGPQGEPRYAVAVSLEITDRKAAEAALKEQNERLKLLWEAAGVLLTTDDPDAMLHGLFDRIREGLGLDAYFNFMVGETPEVLRLASSAGVEDEPMRSVQRLDFGQSVSGMVAAWRKPIVAANVQDAEEPMFNLIRKWGIRAYACYPLLAGNRLLGTLGFASRRRSAFARDELEFLETISQYVTAAYERLRLIAGMREQDRRKDEFLATLSHELRNPLAPIRNGLQLLRLATDPAMAEKARLMMDRQISHMVRLVDDLLDMSRISRNKLTLRRERVDLASVVRTAVETSRPLIDAAGHELAVKLPAEPVSLEADAVRLAQVFSNLLNNAAKYTPRGGRIDLHAEPHGGHVAVTIRDNGVGIAPEQLAHIFDMFVQLERPMESAAGGLGIGLTLVKRLVEMHGGKVEASSEGPDRGSEFVVRLPVVQPKRPDPAPDEASDSRPRRTRRILVADDNEDAAESLAMMLRCLGHEVFTAHDGASAVEMAASVEPDIALLDVGMPRLNGLEAAQRIRAASNGRPLMLVAVTGWGQEEDRRRSRAAGFDHHLVKPVELPMLDAVLEKGPSAAIATGAPGAKS